MQNPYDDTEWNDALRKAGILPPKPDPRKDEPEPQTVSGTLTKDGTKDYATMSVRELDEFEDDDSEFFEQFKRQRLAELRDAIKTHRFGTVLEISGVDYVQEINQAGEGIWVVLHLYKPGVPLCSLINQHIVKLAHKFPDVKFVKSIANTCIPNFPDSSLPAIFVYIEGVLKRQIIGPVDFGGLNLTESGLEWILAESGVLKSELTEDPRLQTKRTKVTTLRGQRAEESDSD